MIVLGIESSCDETAAALVRADGTVLADVVASQVEEHAPYGGVVPELASRAHMRAIVPVVERALAELEGGGRRHRRHRRDPRPGARGRSAGGIPIRQGPGARARQAPGRGRSSRRPSPRRAPSAR